jgi:phage anti-repressor protein
MSSLLDFLKKYSDVDVKFIEDFIKIQEGDKTHDPFKIDLEVMAKWFKTRKEDIKRILVKSYTKNVDYILLRTTAHKEKHGGHNKEIVLLTIDCFKMFAMRSNSKKGDKIRYYYLTLEKLVDIYKDDIIKNQKSKIDKLEYDLRKNVFPVKGAIYIIAVDDGYKIGKTQDLNKRYQLYKTAHKHNPEIKYVFYSKDIDKLENCIKLLLRGQEYKDRKEFYVLELADIIEGIKSCDKYMVNFKCKSCKKIGKPNKFKSHIKKRHNNKEKVAFYGIRKN